MDLIINCDGGSRGNPGPMAIGCVFQVKGQIVGEVSKAVGTGTNNEAEYKAILGSILWLQNNLTRLELNPKGLKLKYHLDSKLVVNQLSGNYKIKQPHLIKLAAQIHQQLNSSNFNATYQYVPREQNSHADALVNQAFDQTV